MKWYGKIVFAITEEDPPLSGIWKDNIVERNYYGDINRLSRTWATASQVNDNLELNIEFSIIADPFAQNNFQSIKCIQWNNVLWKVTRIEPEYPRLRMTIGGQYNGGSQN